ncbi:MAG: hypothetical protein ACFFCD_16235 [Promethearchaeota archaeon]
MLDIVSNVIQLFQLLKNSPYTPYTAVALCFLILVIIQVRKVRGQNKKKRMFLIETHKHNLPIQIESTSHAITFGGEIFDLTQMEKRQKIEIIWILRFLPLFFLSTLLIVFVHLALWPIVFIGLLGVLFVTILGAVRMRKYGNERDYITGRELLDQLSESKALIFKPTVLKNQIELNEINNFFNYLSCEANLRLNDRVSSTWTLYVGLRAIKESNYTLSNFEFSIDKKGINISPKFRDSVCAEDIKKITDFLMDEEDEKLHFSIESQDTCLIARIRFAVREPHRVTDARIKRLAQSFEILEKTSIKVLQGLQT